jgi:hypothetical protein
MMPTSRPSRFTTGLPELPPITSAVVATLNGVDDVNVCRARSHRGDIADDSAAVRASIQARRLPNVDHAGMSPCPFTTP